jgi:hypothetical protein
MLFAGFEEFRTKFARAVSPTALLFEQRRGTADCGKRGQAFGRTSGLEFRLVGRDRLERVVIFQRFWPRAFSPEYQRRLALIGLPPELPGRTEGLSTADLIQSNWRGVAQLNQRGVLTPRGGAWHPTSVARSLSRLQE